MRINLHHILFFFYNHVTSFRWFRQLLLGISLPSNTLGSYI
ncbi:hypothetical protein CoNPh26_CDS0118 [Staphylococcus phage S-CoN_Ph26]|nr:hypothetical protein CoNPh26_CDS0118 [Staphylococcus phage S-CoN_Ph26]